MVQGAEAGDGRRDTRSALVALLAGESGRCDGGLAGGRLVLVCLDDLTNHSKYAAHDVAHCHLPGLGRHQSTANITNARDESLGVTSTLGGYDSEQQLCGGESTWT
jgi:hypothetical protein